MAMKQNEHFYVIGKKSDSLKYEEFNTYQGPVFGIFYKHSLITRAEPFYGFSYPQCLRDLQTLAPALIFVQPFGPHWKKSCLGPHFKYTNTNKN